MSVMLTTENVNISVTTLMAAITVLVIMDINSFKMMPSTVLVCRIEIVSNFPYFTIEIICLASDLQLLA